MLLGLPFLYLLALDRRPSRPPPRILAALTWNSDVLDNMEIIERLEPGWAGLPITLEIRSDERGAIWLTAVRRDPLWTGAPDLQVLYTPPRANAAAPRKERKEKALAEVDPAEILANAVVLGPLAERAWPLPNRAGEGGSILLYSAAQNRFLARTRIPLASRLLFPFVP
jgi:hypothetical protein